VKSFPPLGYPRRLEVAVRRAAEASRAIRGSLSDSLPRRQRERTLVALVRKNRDGRPPLPPKGHAGKSHELPRAVINRHSSQPCLTRDMQWDVIRLDK
jgi:hypothetical protein